MWEADAVGAGDAEQRLESDDFRWLHCVYNRGVNRVSDFAGSCNFSSDGLGNMCSHILLGWCSNMTLVSAFDASYLVRRDDSAEGNSSMREGGRLWAMLGKKSGGNLWFTEGLLWANSNSSTPLSMGSPCIDGRSRST